MADQGTSGIRRICNAACYSFAGLKAAFQNEAAFRLGEGAIEKALLISSVLLVLIIELVNSAIESAIDRIGSDIHELSGRAKDIGSAAVFLSLLNAALIWFFLIVID